MAGGFKLQSAATTGNGQEIDMRGEEGSYALSIETSNATVSAGAVTWEEAPYVGYTGTWAEIMGALTPVQASIVTARFTGALNAVRARISTNVTGGATVTVRLLPPGVD